MSTVCSQCGHVTHPLEASEAQVRISDLEAQVRLLGSKVSTYVDKLADYEDEIRSLRTQCARLRKERETNISVAPWQSHSKEKDAQKEQNRESPPPPPLPEKDPVVNRTITNGQSMSRLSNLASYFPGRRKDTDDAPPVPTVTPGFNPSTPYLQTPGAEFQSSPPSQSPFTKDPGSRSPAQPPSLALIGLQTKLETERQLRQEAENNLTNAQSELEELTAQLFGQANEMVAQERKARAELEERVKLLETRDGEKRRRLERLEGAVARIERVRRMVVEHEKELESAREREEVEVVLQRRVSEKVGRTTVAR